MERQVNFPLGELDEAVAKNLLRLYVATKLDPEFYGDNHASFTRLVDDVVRSLEIPLAVNREERPSGVGCIRVVITPPVQAKVSSSYFANEPPRV